MMPTAYKYCIVATLTLMTSYPGSHVGAFPSFRDLIPNGRRVPSPCVPFFTVIGVGHKIPLGGGARNVFGVDFARNQLKWSTALCQTDSDGDGMTNGEELGDPACTWANDGVLNRTTGITHPGINNNTPRCFLRLLGIFVG